MSSIGLTSEGSRFRITIANEVGFVGNVKGCSRRIQCAINLFLGQVCIQKGIPFALTTRPHLDLGNATLEEIEERYAERIPNAETAAALSEKPARRHKSASQLLRSIKG